MTRSVLGSSLSSKVESPLQHLFCQRALLRDSVAFAGSYADGQLQKIQAGYRPTFSVNVVDTADGEVLPLPGGDRFQRADPTQRDPDGAAAGQKGPLRRSEGLRDVAAAIECAFDGARLRSAT